MDLDSIMLSELSPAKEDKYLHEKSKKNSISLKQRVEKWLPGAEV